MAFVYAVPAPPPSLPENQWKNITILWEGPDGSTWDLTDPTSGVYLNREGVEGLHFGGFTEWTQQSANIRGQIFTGTIAEAREILLPIEVYSETGSTDWLKFNDSWWRSMSPRAYGTLTIALPGGRRYTIKLRLKPKAGHQFFSDPVEDGWCAYLVTMVADDPLFKGSTVKNTFRADVLTDPFFERVGPQLINIAPGSTMATATVDNPGDEDAWLVWRVFGPMETAQVGVGVDVTDIPFPVLEGKVLVIDTDPADQRAIEYTYTPAIGNEPEQFTNPVERTIELTGRDDFVPVPPGLSRKLNLAMTGTGRIEVELTSLHWRVL